MNSKLTLVSIKGGKTRHGRRTKGSVKGKRRPHPWNDLLWKATSRVYYAARADSIETVAERMSKLSRRVLGYHVEVTAKAASYCVYDNRRRHLAYGWMLLHVQKGATGAQRGFVPVLVDVDAEGYELYLLDEADVIFAEAGMKSSLSTVASMLRNFADGVSFSIALLEKAGKFDEARPLREIWDDADYLARKAERTAAQTAKL